MTLFNRQSDPLCTRTESAASNSSYNSTQPQRASRETYLSSPALACAKVQSPTPIKQEDVAPKSNNPSLRPPSFTTLRPPTTDICSEPNHIKQEDVEPTHRLAIKTMGDSSSSSWRESPPWLEPLVRLSSASSSTSKILAPAQNPLQQLVSSKRALNSPLAGSRFKRRRMDKHTTTLSKIPVSKKFTTHRSVSRRTSKRHINLISALYRMKIYASSTSRTMNSTYSRDTTPVLLILCYLR